MEAPGSTRLVQPVSLYVAPWYTYSKGLPGNVCLVKQVTQELISLACNQFAGTLLNAGAASTGGGMYGVGALESQAARCYLAGSIIYTGVSSTISMPRMR